MRLLAMLALAAVSASAMAQSDIGLVNLVSGEVQYAPQAGAPARVKPFMKVREGDRFDIPGGAQLRVVYFESARQERWQGPAAFEAARMQGRPISGSPAETANLPAGVPQRIARVPELMQNAKLGGIQVRAAQPVKRPEEGALKEARDNYEQLRKELPADDITPELYLYSALNEYQLYEEMAPLVTEMLRKQPSSDEVRELGNWLNSRRGR